MALCLSLDAYSVERQAGGLVITLEGWEPGPLGKFAEIIRAAFPGSSFRRLGKARDGFLGLQHEIRLIGSEPAEGKAAVESFLDVLTRSLTVEDSLDESHALAYHQDEDEKTGKLTRSPIGRLVNEAKYRTKRAPRERIGEAVIEFIQAHPRYARASMIASVPSHGQGKVAGLSGRLVQQVAESLLLTPIGIARQQEKAPQKDIPDEDRQVGVRKRLANQRGSMHVNDDLRDEAVVVLDDLYGSGATMQEAARALKAAGATEVLGLCITKQRLFGGVRMVS